MSTGPRERTQRPPRLPIVLVVLALVGAAIYLDQTADTPARAAVEPRDELPTVPAAGVASAAWYCAEGTAAPGGRADETIVVGNVSAEPVHAVVTLMAGGAVVRTRDVEVAQRNQARLAVSALVADAGPPVPADVGVVVETFGGQAVVEHELRGSGDVAIGPCAREARQVWRFAAGTTRRGAQQWLALFNPFGDDAIVDVDFLTGSGKQEPQAAQALVVPRRSRISLAVHDIVPREDIVAVHVRARTGQVVAERSQILDGSDGGAAGLAVSLGVPGVTANRWQIPAGARPAGSTTAIAVANYGVVPVEVDVVVELDGDQSREQPQTVKVDAGTAVTVDVGAGIRAGAGFSVLVRGPDHARLVAEAVTSFGAPGRGIGIIGGATQGARRWALATARPPNGEGVVAVLNVGEAPVTATLLIVDPGESGGPRSAPERAIAAGGRATFVLSEVGVRAGQALIVDAGGPIIVGATWIGDGTSETVAIPFSDSDPLRP